MNYYSNFTKGLLIALLFFFISCSTKDALELVHNGETNYLIVVRKEATEAEKFAATEFQKYVKKISSVSIPIVNETSDLGISPIIKIGTAQLDPDQIEIKVDGNNLILSGGSDQSTLYAVYEFLETYLNCKWYSPVVEEIPELKVVEISKDLYYSYSPEITTRTVHSSLFYENADFAAKQRVSTDAFPHYVPIARVHTFQRFIPEEIFYEEHPEYFALRGDTRLPTQLCLTNPDVLRIVRDSVASFFEKYPESTVISVSQNDNQQYCTDEKCKNIDDAEGGPTGSMIHFVNEIAEQFPDKIISTLAYQYTRKPSKTPPAKNVMITLCSIECDRSGSIEEKCTDFADDLRGWNQISDNIRIWDYTTQFTNFLAPFPNLHTLQKNIKFFKDNSAKWVFEQHSRNPSELFELRSYLMAKLLWDPSRNMDELITEFTNGYYGEGGVFVKKYIDHIHAEIQKNEDFFLFLYGDPSQAFSAYLNPELLQAYDTYFNDAEKAVKGSPELIERVKRARIGVDYAILEASRKNLSKKYNLVSFNDAKQKSINPFVLDKLDNFSTTTEASEIIFMNEMGYTVNEYTANYRKAFAVALKPNKAVGKNVTLYTKPKKYANEDPQVLTDGALGGNGFYANWLGFEGNDLEAVIDLGEAMEISSVTAAFLKVTNHVVFFPLEVEYSCSDDNSTFTSLGKVKNDKPLTKKSKVNEIKYFDLEFEKVQTRYIKIVAKNMKEAPYWHHAAGLPSWIFVDEILID